MTLAEMENEVLSNLQQSELVNFAGSPNWSSATNPEFDQPTVDHYLNRAYLKVMSDLSSIDVALFRTTFASVAQQTQYPLPPSGGPACQVLRRLFYAPKGMTYTLEFEPGARMVPWKEYQRYTAGGYLQPNTYGTQPEICAVTPDRQSIAFYPGPANAGDTITIEYAPVPTTGTAVPLLVNETDEPLLPDDFCDLIVTWALYKLWPKARALPTSESYLQQYSILLDRLRGEWKQRSGGDKQRFMDQIDVRATSGPWGWW